MNNKLLLMIAGLNPFRMLVAAMANAGLLKLAPTFLNHWALRPLLPPPTPARNPHIIVVNDEVGTAKVTV